MIRVFIIIFAVAVLIASGGFFAMQNSLPELDGVKSIPQMASAGSVKFDARQVPYIESASDIDAYRMQGYITAQDRLFQMDMQRRAAQGLLSEVFGASTVPHDKLVRTIGINRAAKQELKQVSHETLAALEAYSQGVNAFLDAAGSKMPMEFLLFSYKPQPWTPLDSIAIAKYKQYELDESWRLDDLRQRILDKAGAPFASYLFQRTFSAPPAVSIRTDADRPSLASLPERESDGMSIGSNAFAVGKKIAASQNSQAGHTALLALDRHAKLTAPCDYYLISMRTPTMHVAGASWPGMPGVFAGRNDEIGFAATSLKADMQDLFLEQFSPQFPNKYRTPQGWSTAEEIVEEIPVRFSKNLFFTSNLLHKITITRHGPVLARQDDNATALAWAGLNLPIPEKSHGLIEATLMINKAVDWPGFIKILDQYKGTAFTFTFANRQGDIGMAEAGAVPIRFNPDKFGKFENLLLNPGWASAGDWVGLASNADFSRVYNPGSSYVVANSSPGRLPLNLNTMRGERIQQVLMALAQKSGTRKIDLSDLALLQGDMQAPLADLVKSTIAETVGKSELIDQYQINAFEVLSKWDGVLSADSEAAAIYESFLRTVMRRIIVTRLDVQLANEYFDRYPAVSDVARRFLTERRVDWLPAEERTFKNFVISSFVQSLKDLRMAQGNEANGQNSKKIVWGDLHQMTVKSILPTEAPILSEIMAPFRNIPVLPVGGDGDTVVTNQALARRGSSSFACQHGPTMRLVVDMSDQDKFYQNLYLGQSGQANSGAARDQLNAWMSLKPLPMAFSTDTESKLSQHRLLFGAR